MIMLKHLRYLRIFQLAMSSNYIISSQSIQSISNSFIYTLLFKLQTNTQTHSMEPIAFPLENQILARLKNADHLNSLDLAAELNVNHLQLYGKLQSLLVENYITLDQSQTNKWILTKEGDIYADKGTPEFQLYSLIPEEGIAQKDLEAALGADFKIAQGNAMKKKLVQIKEGKLVRVAQNQQDEDKARLLEVRAGNKVSDDVLKVLKTRKLIEQKTFTHYSIRKGSDYRDQKVKLQPDLTSEMIQTGEWQNLHFKKFNLEALGAEIENGNLHPLMKTRTEFRSILLELGFEEMKTNRYVESSFWNFDSLFQPQAHPARDAHDTFFVVDPAEGKVEDKHYWEEVRNIHEKGGFGSSGYNYNWEDKEGLKNILRTHTTAISARTLYEIAKNKDFRPRKFFSIDRVFRNETLDMTHLAEFHQIEGFVIDRNLGLPHLIGIITEFYKKIGIEKIWLKPTYNPYTEPSMEIYGYHPVLKRKVQIGNSGIFRPEMLRPMGFPEDMNVIAWGLGLERPTMIQYNISNIKELFGPGVSLRKLKENGICCLTK